MRGDRTSCGPSRCGPVVSAMNSTSAVSYQPSPELPTLEENHVALAHAATPLARALIPQLDFGCGGLSRPGRKHVPARNPQVTHAPSGPRLPALAAHGRLHAHDAAEHADARALGGAPAREQLVEGHELGEGDGPCGEVGEGLRRPRCRDGQRAEGREVAIALADLLRVARTCCPVSPTTGARSEAEDAYSRYGGVWICVCGLRRGRRVELASAGWLELGAEMT